MQNAIRRLLSKFLILSFLFHEPLVEQIVVKYGKQGKYLSHWTKLQVCIVTYSIHLILPQFFFTGIHFGDDSTHYVGDVGYEKVAFEPVRTKKAFITICSFNYMQPTITSATSRAEHACVLARSAYLCVYVLLCYHACVLPCLRVYALGVLTYLASLRDQRSYTLKYLLWLNILLSYVFVCLVCFFVLFSLDFNN